MVKKVLSPLYNSISFIPKFQDNVSYCLQHIFNNFIKS